MLSMKRLSLALGAAALLLAGTTRAQDCGTLTNAYGPYDYRTNADKLVMVEAFHFTPDVEFLRRGAQGTIGADLDYTLRASPNHHRALMAAVNLALRERKPQPQAMKFTIDCYFDRAERFAEDDGTVRMIHGIYLSRTGQKDEALQRLNEALSLGADSPTLQYNLGLAYLDVKQYDEALSHAHRAYELGVTLPGLRNRLKAAGQWREPAPATADAAKDAAQVR
jgi:tetratricopeptide (TPR) repeat protein